MFKFDCFAKWIEKSLAQRTRIANPDQKSRDCKSGSARIFNSWARNLTVYNNYYHLKLLLQSGFVVRNKKRIHPVNIGEIGVYFSNLFFLYNTYCS